jgi:hypothetical protein
MPAAVSVPVPPPMMHGGPIYCETGHPWLGMAEPVNTITNAAILIAAYYAYRFVRKSQVGFSPDLVLMLILLAGVGIGSTLWHGLRTHWALQLDWIPGVAFLIVFTALWFRQLFGWTAGIIGAVAMYALPLKAGACHVRRWLDPSPDRPPYGGPTFPFQGRQCLCDHGAPARKWLTAPAAN